MKKNLLSILILALLIINIAMTAVMMISVTSTNKKTAAIVTDIASILKLEMGNGETGSSEEANAVSLEDTVLFDLPEEMTILLAKGADEKQHFAMVKVSLSMDSTSEAYKKYGESMSTRVSLIEGIVSEVIGKYTADEIQPRSADIQTEILNKLQSPEMFDSDFIYKVTFSKLIVQ